MSEKILFINSCPRRDSRTALLAEHLLSLSDIKAEEINLYDESITPLGEKEISERDCRIKHQDYSHDSFRYAKQFAQADTIVIAAPLWDLSFPSMLKVYFENITVCGLTFRYCDNGKPEGMCKAKKLYYVTTAGGFIGSCNFGFDYVKALCENLFGINEAVCFTAEGLDIKDADTNKILDEAKKKINNHLKGETL